MNPNPHIHNNIDSMNMMSGYGVMLSKVKTGVDGNVDTADPRYIGLISNITFSDNRQLTQQGELGSRHVYTLISEGQKSLSFQRLIPYKSDSDKEYVGTILGALYHEEIETIDGESDPGSFLFDIEEYNAYRKPIQLLLDFLDENGDYVGRLWLYNASIGGANIQIGSGTQMSIEPCTISWEETKHLDPTPTPQDQS